MKIRFKSAIAQRVFSLGFIAAIVFSCAPDSFGGYTITLTEVSPFQLTVADNDPSLHPAFSASVGSTSLTGDVWTVTIPETLLGTGAVYTAEPGVPTGVNSVSFAASTFTVYSDVSKLSGSTVQQNNTNFFLGTDSNQNQVFLVFNDLPGHDANGADVPDATATALLLGLSVVTLFGAARSIGLGSVFRCPFPN